MENKAMLPPFDYMVPKTGNSRPAYGAKPAAAWLCYIFVFVLRTRGKMSITWNKKFIDKKVGVFSVLLAMSFSVIADEPIKGWSSSYIEPDSTMGCDKDAYEMAICAGKKMAHSEQFLKELIKKITKIIPEEQSKPFSHANHLWFQFRDASCDFDSATAGGSSKSMHLGECMHSYNKTRIEMLSKYYYCITGGDCSNDLHLYHLVCS